MGKTFEYTTLAYRYTARFPRATYIGTQVNFWIIANLLLIIILTLQAKIIGQAYGLPVGGRLGPMLWIAVLFGVLYGSIVGLVETYLARRMFIKQALGKILLLKTITSLAILVLILTLTRYIFFDAVLVMPGMTLREESWKSAFFLLLIYYFVMTLIISFINQINRKFGPGVLLPLLLGRYRDPKEEERIFMFMDLKSSTTTAEQLGHLKYSAFIRDCFSDINEVLYPFRAQVYQYVGDEIVVTWPESEGLHEHFCIRFYFACKKQFRNRTHYYQDNYGFVPTFKAGIHTGLVTAVEIGEVKKDIAYHGDTLNTAARIQSVCNDFNQTFIASKILLDKLGAHPGMLTTELGMILLKGKVTRIGLLSVDWVEEAR